MELLKLTTLLCCTYITFASQHTHIIPVENYDTELQDLGQHVDVHETPVKVIKITKTIAVKIPVPYPVKVLEKVPYPVHISKPYPVPVPQIVKVPTVINVGSKDKSGYGASDDHSFQSSQDFGGNSYKVNENPSSEIGNGYKPVQNHQSYGGFNSASDYSTGNEHSSEGSSEGYHGAPLSEYYGSGGSYNGINAFPSGGHDEGFQKY